MKRILTIALALAMSLGAGAQVQALFGYSTFCRPSTLEPYVESYLLFDAWTLHFAPMAEGGFRATADITLRVSQGDSVYYGKHYELHSPVVQDREAVGFNILDVQRFSLPNGIYDIVITLRDKELADSQEATMTEKLYVAYNPRTASLSSVQLMASIRPTTTPSILSRGGYDMEPYVDDYVPEQIRELTYYCEAYNLDKELGNGSPFLVMTYLEQAETGLRLEYTVAYSRKQASDYLALLGTVDISQVPSGNYNLVVDLRTRQGQTMLLRRVPFIRSNPSVQEKVLSDFAGTFAGKYNNEEELNLYLSALYPIASSREEAVAEALVKRPALEEKQSFLYEFWTSRYGTNAEAEWLKYKERIDYVQSNFSYPRTRGIVTDRGRVYLQYGPPDFIRDEKNMAVLNNPSENASHAFYAPYQLWRYDRMEKDGERHCFLFWDQFRSGYYTLLHSDAIGEVQEWGWERRLSGGLLQEEEEGIVGKQFKRGY